MQAYLLHISVTVKASPHVLRLMVVGEKLHAFACIILFKQFLSYSIKFLLN